MCLEKSLETFVDVNESIKTSVRKQHKWEETSEADNQQTHSVYLLHRRQTMSCCRTHETSRRISEWGEDSRAAEVRTARPQQHVDYNYCELTVDFCASTINRHPQTHYVFAPTVSGTTQSFLTRYLRAQRRKLHQTGWLFSWGKR